MPTETKNNTAKASRIGNASDAARELNSLRPTTMPARKAPSAIETSNTFAAPTATPSATTSTVSVKSSRDRDRATCDKHQGTNRPPTYITKATNRQIFATATTTAQPIVANELSWLPKR